MTENDPSVSNGHIRLLRWLVTTLTATMIVGLIVLIVLFVTRFPDPGAAPFPQTIRLPEGTRVTAFTRGPDWFAVVTEAQEILILDAETQAVRQRIAIEHD